MQFGGPRLQEASASTTRRLFPVEFASLSCVQYPPRE